MNGGQVILADEPTGALDSHSSVEVMAILKQLQQQGHTVIIVTHDPTVAAQAERVIEIKDGRIMADSGSKNEPVVAAAELMSLTPAAPSWQQLVGRFREALLMAWRAMSANKMRTALTMLGIIIGIASVVSILVVGDAAKQLVLADIRAIGTNTIDIYPGKDFGDDDPSTRQALVHDDMAALKAQSYVSAVSPSIGGSMRLRFGNIDVAASVLGVSDEYFRVFGMAMEQGAPITREQVERQAQTVVIDLNTQRRLFPHMKDVVGQVILVGNMPATVVGVVAEKKIDVWQQ